MGREKYNNPSGTMYQLHRLVVRRPYILETTCTLT